MTRRLVALSLVAPFLGAWLLALLPGSAVQGAELPLRKAGLWEMKLVRTGSPVPEMTMQHCTDETTDRDMSTASSPLSKEVCSRHEVRQTAAGYVSDSVCSIAGVSVKSHADISGDFNSAYTVKTTSHREGGAAGSHEAGMTIEAKWLGACKPGQKPGDIVMPGGFKLNIKDAEKLKGLLPK